MSAQSTSAIAVTVSVKVALMRPLPVPAPRFLSCALSSRHNVRTLSTGFDNTKNRLSDETETFQIPNYSYFAFTIIALSIHVISPLYDFRMS